jgi:hypothetical protein
MVGLLYFRSGITSFVGGRPKPTPCLKLFSFLYPKSKLDATITLGDKEKHRDLVNTCRQDCVFTLAISEVFIVSLSGNQYQVGLLIFFPAGSSSASLVTYKYVVLIFLKIHQI